MIEFRFRTLAEPAARCQWHGCGALADFLALLYIDGKQVDNRYICDDCVLDFWQDMRTRVRAMQ